MEYMFDAFRPEVTSFNQDISTVGAWTVDSVTNMTYMFRDASAFDQDLGWCVNEDVDLGYDGRHDHPVRVAVLWRLIMGGCDIPSDGNVMANGRSLASWDGPGVTARCSVALGRHRRRATYGHIGRWRHRG